MLPWVLQSISVNTRPINQPQRVGLQIPPRRWIIIAHPVLVQAGLALKPLTGEAEVYRRSCGCLHPAKRQIAGLLDFQTSVIRGETWPSDLIRAHVIHRVVLDHCNGNTIKPDVFPQQAAGLGHVIIEVFGL